MQFLSSLTPEQVQTILIQILKTALNWWWLYLPPVLFIVARDRYLYWKEEKWFERSVKPVMLEIKIPEEVAKTPRAMEHVFNGWWQLYAPPNWREKWVDGEFQLGFSCEIVGIDGRPHFFIRLPKSAKGLFESKIYAQFPDAEITEVEDYTKQVPQDVPNKDWDLWGFDFTPTKKNCYPIKTYMQFEEENIKEEKRIDPLANFLEGMSKLKQGEQIWFQVIARPVLMESEFPWRDEGKKIIENTVKGKKEKKMEPFFDYIAKSLKDAAISGKPPAIDVEKEEKLDLGALRLAPNQTDTIKAIGNKISKHGFLCNIRTIYIGKKDVFFKANGRIPMSYLSGELASPELNTLKYWGPTATKIVYFMKKRRLFLRKRRLFRQYTQRNSPRWPVSSEGMYILNTEELATIFHFPGRQVAPAPTMERVEAKKSGPPSSLPIG